MKKKLGRNDPCWCGSKKKYKKCHLNRSDQAPVNPFQAAKQQQKAFSVKQCLVPDEMKSECENTIVKAHTVSKGSSIKKIARNGHVYSFVPSMDLLVKHHGKLPPKLVGVNNASTFTGFCGKHDNLLFSPIEDRNFEGEKEQCLLLGYRAIAREYYTKQASVVSHDARASTDAGRSLDEQQKIQEFAFLFNIGSQAGLRDINFHKKDCEQHIIKAEFDDVRYLRIRLTEAPPIMGSGGVSIEYDFHGNTLQDAGKLDETLELLCFNSFYGGDFGEVVFTWLPYSDKACKAFCESLLLLPEDQQTDALIRFFFETCENLHISPDWWENLAPNKRQALIDRMAASATPTTRRSTNVLCEDGVRFDKWEVQEIDYDNGENRA